MLPGDGPQALTLLDRMGYFSGWGELIGLCKIQAIGFRWECIGSTRHETDRNAETKQNDYFLYSHTEPKTYSHLDNYLKGYNQVSTCVN